MEVIQVVCGILLSPDHSRVLIVNNVGGIWSVPGGGVEPGEHIRDAVVREFHEETGLAARVVRLVSIGEAFKTSRPAKVFYFNFLMEQVDPGAQPFIVNLDEISEIRWASREEIKTDHPYIHDLLTDHWREAEPVIYGTNPRFP